MNTNLDDINLIRDILKILRYQFWCNYLLQILYPFLKFTKNSLLENDQCITSAFSAFYLILHCSNKEQKEGYIINLPMHSVMEP